MRNLQANAPPLILDCDASVLPLGKAEIRLSLQEWQERVRFGATLGDFARFSAHLDACLPDGNKYGWVFTGSGDFHHLTLYLLRRLAAREKLPPASLDLIVCDNHPDNMRYPFGLHCGSWVRHAAALPCIRHIHVLGITSADIGIGHAWENNLTPLWQKKLGYWSIGVRASWLSLLGRGGQARAFDSADALLAAFLPVLKASRALYLSLDKDVLHPQAARCNWDQGLFTPAHLEAVLRAAAEKIHGIDVCGDPSVYAYRSRFKRLLSRLDGQTIITPEELRAWQEEHRRLNLRLLEAIK
ncbi:hypothetical protein FACS189475_04440 [Betaproteobacteria bacterium]|nr:hypothetical protein FACS189475_04440 [Betaproteobacteria bacterium]